MSSTSVGSLGHPHPHETFFRAPNWINAIDMGASSAASLVIPAGVQFVRLAANLDFYVNWGTTAVSTGTASGGAGSELIPLQSGGVLRSIGSTSATPAISVMSTAAAHLTASWWIP